MNKVTLLAVLLALFLQSTTALAINKCAHNGKITYTDLPCPDGANYSAFTSQVIPPSDVQGTKRRHLANQHELEKIQQQKAKEAIQQKHEEQAWAAAQKKNDEHAFKCRQLNSKRKLAQEHLMQTKMKGRNKASQHANSELELATEKYQHYCEPH